MPKEDSDFPHALTHWLAAQTSAGEKQLSVKKVS